jgi:hypothetical protein
MPENMKKETERIYLTLDLDPMISKYVSECYPIDGQIVHFDWFFDVIKSKVVVEFLLEKDKLV